MVPMRLISHSLITRVLLNARECGPGSFIETKNVQVLCDGLECSQKLLYDQDKRFRNLKRETARSPLTVVFRLANLRSTFLRVTMSTLDMDEAVRQTRELLDSGDCIILKPPFGLRIASGLSVPEQKGNRRSFTR